MRTKTAILPMVLTAAVLAASSCTAYLALIFIPSWSA